MSVNPEDVVNDLVAVYTEAAAQELGLEEQTLRNMLRVDLVESAIGNVFQGYYTDVETRAARLLVGLIRNHPLPDGNKRCAWITTRFYLLTEGYDVLPDISMAFDLIVMVASGEIPDSKVIEWMSELIVEPDSPADEWWGVD